MAVSPVDAVNRALLKLGADRIESLDDDGEDAQAAKVAYETVRDAVTAAAAWRFAMRRALLSTVGPVPAFDYTRSLQLPADCLRVVGVGRDVDDLRISGAVVEGRYILDNGTDPLKVRYLGRVTDLNQWHPLAIESLVLAIAQELCEKITGTRTMTEMLERSAAAKLVEARMIDAIEAPARALTDSADWLVARLS